MCPFVLAQRTAGSWRPWKPWHSTRTSWLQLCHKTRALRGNTWAFSTSGYSCSPRLQEILWYPSAMFCVTPLDDLYVVPFGQGQVARGYPSLERSPSPLPQSSADSESTASHSEETPLLGCSLQLCPTHILTHTKLFFKSGNSQQDLSTSAPTFYPFAHLLV